MIVNKIDAVSKDRVIGQLSAASSLGAADYFPVSAKTGEGIPALIAHLTALMPEGPLYFPDDTVSDQPEETWVAELVREQLLAVTHDELPYSIATRVTEWEWPRIRVEIIVERESQKGMVIGKGGAVLERGRQARPRATARGRLPRAVRQGRQGLAAPPGSRGTTRLLMATPSAEIDIDEPLVRSLLAEQQPALADRTLRFAANGWDNVVVQLGDDLMVRLPRRAAAAQLVLNEQRWLPFLARSLPLPTPSPIFAGAPGTQYPWAWSICPWLPGDSAAKAPPSDPHDAALTLAAFVVALHKPAPHDAPENPFRGVHLQQRAEAVEGRVRALDDVVASDRVLGVWNELRHTPAWSGPAMWLHGDLHPSNMLTDNGRLSAVIDFGDITSGDPATDLALAWMMFGPREREVFREAAAIDDDTWRRAAGWALNLSLAYLTGDDTTSMPSIGRVTLSAVLEEFS